MSEGMPCLVESMADVKVDDSDVVMCDVVSSADDKNEEATGGCGSGDVG
jgi:hypothetical protein